jgi:hypothetical protein
MFNSLVSWSFVVEEEVAFFGENGQVNILEGVMWDTLQNIWNSLVTATSL